VTVIITTDCLKSTFHITRWGTSHWNLCFCSRSHRLVGIVEIPDEYFRLACARRH